MKSRNLSKARSALIIVFVAMIFRTPSGAAYETDIRADIQEVYSAALAVLKPYGIHKADEAAHLIETEWIPGETSRRRSFFGIGMTRKYQKKSQVTLHLDQGERFTHVNISSRFLFKDFSSSPQSPWRNLRPSHEDAGIEKEMFRRILAQMEINRLKS